ncbi:MAG: hypothetical protein KBI01_08210 [Oscillospiraceae bacterium]|nr:hypothetical protein [Oscillospiraceae bacterium]
MRNNSLKLCGFTLIMGIFGAFLRWLQIQNIYEADTGLAARHSPWSYTLVLFFLLFAVLLWLWIRKLKDVHFTMKYPEVYSKSIPFASVVAIIIGVIMALGGALTLIRSVQTSKTVFDLVLGLITFICAAGMASFIGSASNPKKKGNGYFGAISIVFYLCFWLIAAYKFSAKDPVTWNFAPRLLAISATLLAFYFIAGFVFNKPRPLASLYLGLLGTFMCIITIADTYPLGEQFITVGFIASMTLLSFSQLNSAHAESPAPPKD